MSKRHSLPCSLSCELREVVKKNLFKGHVPYQEGGGFDPPPSIRIIDMEQRTKGCEVGSDKIKLSFL